MNHNAICVVGIGASAGGIDAFRRFFENMPADSGFAFVVILHLAAGRKSMLAEILARWTAMSVTEAADGDAVVANHVHVIPAGTIARLRDGCLSLKQLGPDGPRDAAPIDAFLDSLATCLNEDAIGIVLSGTGHDGALGLKSIKAHGGLTLAQGTNGTSPEYSGMPDSAVATGAVDLHIPVQEMPGQILASRPIRLDTQRDAGRPVLDNRKFQSAVSDILRSRLGHDFSQYKLQTFLRRVQRRMQVLRLTTPEDYITRLRNDREQVVLLFRDLLISVTSFFRDSETFVVLEKEIIPRLFRGKDAASDVRIWVPGCATGEEAYSIAMLVSEYMDTLPSKPKVHVFGSDIDDVAIATARAGRYPESLVEGMSPDRRARFFAESPSGCTVRPDIRKFCAFSAHSLIRDPPFSRIDLISCRNLLIYLDNDLQDQVIPIFHYALVPGGVLVLGPSETITRHERLFLPLDRSHRIFVRQDGPAEISSVYQLAVGDTRSGLGSATASRSDPKSHWAKAVAVANRRVLERFASPFVVVNASGEVAHFSSHTGRFLEPALGAPSSNLFEMARKGWNLELRTALRRCIETGRPVEQQRSTVSSDNDPSAPVRLIVEPLPGADTDPLYMIVVVELDQPRPVDEQPATGAIPESIPTITHLENENRELREQMQSIAEEHATAVEELRSANEELQSVNEELQSTNEELQSTNEELQTSREEIQSINEELSTVNAQLTNKLEQLDRSNSDLKNLFDSTKVATVFLDSFLIIRNFTPEPANQGNHWYGRMVGAVCERKTIIQWPGRSRRVRT